MQQRPISIDLFAGAGGMSLGFEQAGFDIAAAVEVDPVHCAVHKFNFPKTTIIPQSVESLSGKDIRTLAGIGNREIDCVFGGAPCQGFSLIGQRALNDPRNKLVAEFVRIVTELNAKTFVFENVKGLTLGKHRHFLDQIVSAFLAAGYETQLPWKVLNAANYQVPQNRQRLFLIGAKKGAILPGYPEPSSNQIGIRHQISGLPVGPTVADALDDLPNADRYQTLLTTDSVKTTAYQEASGYAQEMRCLTNNAWHFGYTRAWNSSYLTSSARTDHTDISRRRFAETLQGSVEPISRFYRLSANGISNTLRAGTDGARGAFTSPRPIHHKHNRCITVREMARLHGFPDWFRFNATKWHGARQIGNSVPPPLARSVANCIVDSLKFQPSSPDEVMDLGDPKLLSFTVSQAAAHFGVEAPSSRRDRKSGALKRKQIDIEQERLDAKRLASHG